MVSAAAALVSVALAFLLSYTINCTNVPPLLKRAIGLLAQLPMLLPTITYGFAIIYTFGRTGLLTRLLGFQLFDIYGFNGLLLGYVIYTLPTAFLLVDNSFRFIDKRFMIVSRVMGDSPLQTFVSTVLRPLAGALCVAFVQRASSSRSPTMASLPRWVASTTWWPSSSTTRCSARCRTSTRARSSPS